jgi:2-dehydro-3-deoxyphosphogluconate aldolase/(4S)-4-hydroxy-2-oxoglutarate aldolase
MVTRTQSADTPDLLGLLRTRRIMGGIRGRYAEASVRTAEVLVDEGIDLLEVSLTGADPMAVIRRIRAELGARVTLGAGTVLTTAQAEEVAAAGASLAVTAAMSAGAVRAVELGLPTLIGAMTPTEVWQASLAGAADGGDLAALRQRARAFRAAMAPCTGGL